MSGNGNIIYLINQTTNVPFLDPGLDLPVQELNICEHKNATLSCPSGQVISVSKAVYGRQDGETCSVGPYL